MRFGRKARDEDPVEGIEDDATAEEAPAAAVEASGPYDASEIEDLEDRDCVDLGSLLVTPADGMELRLQVDEGSGEVLAAVLMGESAALELRAFAAARGGGAWDELRPRISAETERLGGTVVEEEGTFGTELVCQVPMETPDGQQGLQVSRISGHQGSNWLLRATLMGQPVVEPDTAGPWVETIRSVVVRRGREAMAPGAALPLTLPPEARRVD